MAVDLLERIERLERQNRRMSVAVSAMCLGLGALLTMGQTLPKKAERNLEWTEAREIVLTDGLKTAKLTPDSLVLSAESGREADKITIRASGISLSGRYATEIKPSGFTCSRDGVPRFDLSVGEIGAAMAFKNSYGSTGTMLDESTMVLMNHFGILSMRPEHLFLQKGEADAFLTPTSLKIRDTDKFKAILGKADLAVPQTGDRRAGTAASLTLFGRDDAVLWQTP